MSDEFEDVHVRFGNGTRTNTTQPIPVNVDLLRQARSDDTAITQGGISADTTPNRSPIEQKHEDVTFKTQLSPNINHMVRFHSFDSDDDEIAFGTTVPQDGVMSKFQQHNRTQSKAMSSLLSPHHFGRISEEQDNRRFPTLNMNQHTATM
eukprot:280148_1